MICKIPAAFAVAMLLVSASITSAATVKNGAATGAATNFQNNWNVSC